jgi:hypothetical protein
VNRANLYITPSNIERNDVANGRNIARNGASKWLLEHNVRPTGVKKDIAIVSKQRKRSELVGL